MASNTATLMLREARAARDDAAVVLAATVRALLAVEAREPAVPVGRDLWFRSDSHGVMHSCGMTNGPPGCPVGYHGRRPGRSRDGESGLPSRQETVWGSPFALLGQPRLPRGSLASPPVPVPAAGAQGLPLMASAVSVVSLSVVSPADGRSAPVFSATGLLQGEDPRAQEDSGSHEAVVCRSYACLQTLQTSTRAATAPGAAHDRGIKAEGSFRVKERKTG
jgi:hypothetical protein